MSYGCESWTIRKNDENRIRVFENKVLRKISGPVCDPEWRRRTNVELRELTKQEDVVIFIKKRRLRWAGHVARMDLRSYPRRTLQHKESGKRPKGRPRNRWTNDIQRDTGQHQPWQSVAEDRDRWRRIVAEAKSRPPTSAPRS